MENWTEIKIAVNAKDIDKASDIANVVVPYGIYIEDYTNLEQEVEDIAHIDLIDEDLLKKDRNKAFVHVYLEPDVSPSEAVAFLSERYSAEGIEHTIELLDCAIGDHNPRNPLSLTQNPSLNRLSIQRQQHSQ